MQPFEKKLKKIKNHFLKLYSCCFYNFIRFMKSNMKDSAVFVFVALAFILGFQVADLKIFHVLRFYNLDSRDLVDLDKIPITPRCTSCPRIYFPVCGDDNRTYLNQCMLKCKNVLSRTPENYINFTRNGPCDVFPEE